MQTKRKLERSFETFAEGEEFPTNRIFFYFAKLKKMGVIKSEKKNGGGRGVKKLGVKKKGN